MVAATRIRMTDISGQKEAEVDLAGPITPRHTIGQALEFGADQMGIPHDGVPLTAFSRGVKLDNKRPLNQLRKEDTDWQVMSEVSAG